MTPAPAAVVYLGTRACDGALEDALREHVEPLPILVPADPRLLGPVAEAAEAAADLGAVCELVAARARARAAAVLDRERRRLGRVFEGEAGGRAPSGTTADATVVGSELAAAVAATGVNEAFVARDALEVLDKAGVDLAGELDRHGITLRAR